MAKTILDTLLSKRNHSSTRDERDATLAQLKALLDVLLSSELENLRACTLHDFLWVVSEKLEHLEL